jgi:hypothetical protein
MIVAGCWFPRQEFHCEKELYSVLMTIFMAEQRPSNSRYALMSSLQYEPRWKGPGASACLDSDTVGDIEGQTGKVL